MEVLGTIAAVFTILVTVRGVVKWWKGRRPSISAEDSEPSEPPIEDMWVDLKYVDDAGVTQRLQGQGYRVRWSTANEESRRVNLEGWEIVVDQTADGRRVCYKARDHAAVGGYMIYLRKRDPS